MGVERDGGGSDASSRAATGSALAAAIPGPGVETELAGMRRLYEVQAALASQTDLKAALEEILAAACTLTATDRGCIQLVPGGGEGLETYIQRGYGPQSSFVDHFLRDGAKPICEAARKNRARLIIEDVATFRGLLSPEDRRAALADGVLATQSTPMITRSGELVGMLSTQFRQPHLVEDHELKLIDILALTAADFVERHRMEAARQAEREARLNRSEAQLRTILKAGRFGAWTYEIATGDLISSETCRANFGRPPAEPFTYAQLREAIHPLDRDRIAAAVERCIATGEDYDIEYRIVTPSGEPRWIEIRAQPSYDAAGVPLRLSGVSVDVTERHKVKDALDASEARYRRLFESIDAGVCVIEMIFDAEGRPVDYVFLEVNPAFARQTGLVDARGKRMRTLRPDHEQHWFDIYGRVAMTGEPIHFENEAAALERWYEVYAYRIGAPEERRVEMLFNDITERRESEAKLKDMNDTLEERVVARTAELEAAHRQLHQVHKLEAMGNLTGGVAHDFNNLLTPIVGVLDLLQRSGLGGEREQRLIAGAALSADRAKTLVQRLLAFARRQPLQTVAVDIGRLVRNMAELVATTTGPQVKVVVEVADRLPPARADVNQMEMALLNLAVNARDAMPEGGVLRITAFAKHAGAGEHDGLRAGDYVCLSVADTGHGMDEDTLTRAVEPFFSTKGVGKGTGLGLSMVHGLASQLGGKLIVQSKIGVGTNVELWLPRSDEDLAASTQSAESGSSRHRGSALLVEDDEAVRVITADMLSDLGYHVIEAASAQEALGLLRKDTRVDVVVTDHLMPGMNGTELARVVQTERAGTPILIVSGYADAAGIASDLPFLTKPFVRAELSTALSGLLHDA